MRLSRASPVYEINRLKSSILTPKETTNNALEALGIMKLKTAVSLYDLGADKDYIYKKLYQNNIFEVEMLKNGQLNLEII